MPQSFDASKWQVRVTNFSDLFIYLFISARFNFSSPKLLQSLIQKVMGWEASSKPYSSFLKTMLQLIYIRFLVLPNRIQQNRESGLW